MENQPQNLTPAVKLQERKEHLSVLLRLENVIFYEIRVIRCNAPDKHISSDSISHLCHVCYLVVMTKTHICPTRNLALPTAVTMTEAGAAGYSI